LPDASQGRRTVLITRPAAEAAITAARVTALGFVPLVAPFLTIRLAKPALPAGTQATLVTSGNALAALTPGDAPLLAVGDATAARATDLGFSRVHSAGRDAAALAELAVRLLNPAHGPLLLASGAGQGGALAADLRARGFRVQRRVCYESVTVRRFPRHAASALRQNTVHAALFMSAETARSFARLLPAALHPALGGVLALTIGNAAADALNELPWRGIRRAATPTLDDVLALL
jgi:uroporphyrinogen-III synthase